MDIALTQLINAPAGSSPLLDSVMIALTKGGVPLMVLLVAAQWWARVDRVHVRHAALSAGLSFLLGLAVNQFILLFIHRLRPYATGVSHLIIARSTDWSFPSDHATASMAIVATFAMQGLPRRTLGLLLLALLICLSRVYVGTHYVSDILGGWATAVAAAVIVRLLYREGSRLDRFATGIL